METGKNNNQVPTEEALHIADVSISKNQLLERLNIEFYFKYHQYPEGEAQEDYPKRCLKGEGFLNAIKVVADFY